MTKTEAARLWDSQSLSLAMAWHPRAQTELSPDGLPLPLLQLSVMD